MNKRGTYTMYKCPICGEETPVDRDADKEAFNDWMDEYGWYRTGKARWICPDCYEYEGAR